MNAASQELKPCPFCGNQGQFQDVSISDEDWPGANGDWWLAGCEKCDIWLPKTEYVSKGQARVAWNTRKP